MTCRAFVSRGAYTTETRRCEKSRGLKTVVIPKAGRTEVRVRLCAHHVAELDRKGLEILSPRQAKHRR